MTVASEDSLYWILPTARSSRESSRRVTGVVSTLAIARAWSESCSIAAAPDSAALAGISGISQIGHVPGRSRRTCGCIEQVWTCCAADAAGGAPEAVALGRREAPRR